jgi:uncharacterized protein
MEPGRSLHEMVLQDCLAGELRMVNAGLPQRQKQLSDLLGEEYPHVLCNDNSTHLFKRNELEYLADMLDTDEQNILALPLLVEVGAHQAEVAVLCQTRIEERVVSRVLDMPVICEQGRIRLYRPQLALLRRKLRTTTVYIFSSRSVA